MEVEPGRDTTDCGSSAYPGHATHSVDPGAAWCRADGHTWQDAADQNWPAAHGVHVTLWLL